MDICLANTWDSRLGAAQPRNNQSHWQAKTLVLLILFWDGFDSFDSFIACSCHMHNIFLLSFLPPNYVNFDKWYHRQTDDESTLSWVGFFFFFVEQLKRSLGSCLLCCLGKVVFPLAHLKKVKSLPKLRACKSPRKTHTESSHNNQTLHLISSSFYVCFMGWHLRKQ